MYQSGGVRGRGRDLGGAVSAAVGLSSRGRGRGRGLGWSSAQQAETHSPLSRLDSLITTVDSQELPESESPLQRSESSDQVSNDSTPLRSLDEDFPRENENLETREGDRVLGNQRSGSLNIEPLSSPEPHSFGVRSTPTRSNASPARSPWSESRNIGEGRGRGRGRGLIRGVQLSGEAQENESPETDVLRQSSLGRAEDAEDYLDDIDDEELLAREKSSLLQGERISLEPGGLSEQGRDWNVFRAQCAELYFDLKSGSPQEIVRERLQTAIDAYSEVLNDFRTPAEAKEFLRTHIQELKSESNAIPTFSKDGSVLPTWNANIEDGLIVIPRAPIALENVDREKVRLANTLQTRESFSQSPEVDIPPDEYIPFFETSTSLNEEEDTALQARWKLNQRRQVLAEAGVSSDGDFGFGLDIEDPAVFVGYRSDEGSSNLAYLTSDGFPRSDSASLRGYHARELIPSDGFVISPKVASASSRGEPKGSTAGSGGKSGLLRLDVFLEGAALLDHPFFSEEHILAVELKETYRTWFRRKQLLASDYFERRLEAVRRAIRLHESSLSRPNSTNRSSQEENSSVAVGTRSEHRAAVDQSTNLRWLRQKRALLEDFLRARIERDEESRIEKRLLVAMNEIWKQIKLVRRETNSQETSISMKFSVSQETHPDEVEYQRDIDQALEFFQNLREVDEDIARLTNRPTPSYSSLCGLMEEPAENRRSRLENEYMASHFDPGSAIVTPFLTLDSEARVETNSDENRTVRKEEVTSSSSRTLLNSIPDSHEPESSPMRDAGYLIQQEETRSSYWKSRLQIRLVVNGNSVARSSIVPADELLDARFADSFSLYVVTKPQSIALDLFLYDSSNREYLVGRAPVDMRRVHLQGEDSFADFSTGESFQPLHILRERFLRAVQPSWLTGSVSSLDIGFRAAASASRLGMTAARYLPPRQYAARVRFRLRMSSASGSVDGSKAKNLALSAKLHIEEIRRLLEGDTFDPNDPANIALLGLVDELQLDASVGSTSLSGFSLLPPHNLSAFVNRYQGLSRRQQLALLLTLNSTADSSLTKLPMTEQEIIPSMLRSKKHSQKERDRLSHYSAQVRAVRSSEIAKKSLRVEEMQTSDVVLEPILPDLGRIWDAIVQFFMPRHPLRPPRPHIEPAVRIPSTCALVIEIARGYRLPIRKWYLESHVDLPETSVNSRFTDTSSTFRSRGVGMQSNPSRSSDQHGMGRRNIHRLRSEDAEGIDVPEPDRMSIDEDEFDNDPNDSTEESVHPVVRVQFRGKELWSSVKRGPDPVFNELMEVEFDIPNGNVSAIHENIEITLFDELLIENPLDIRLRATHRSTRREYRYLGVLSVPFSTVLVNQKIEGSFPLDVPLINLGYVSPPDHLRAYTSSKRFSPSDGLSSSRNVELQRSSTFRSSTSSISRAASSRRLLRDLDVQNEQRDESEIGNRSRTEVNPPVSSLSRRRVQFNDPQPRDNMEVEDDDIQESPALLSVFLSLKPILPAPDAEEKSESSSLSLKTLQFCRSWENTVKNSRFCQDRHVKVIVNNSSGDEELICRYICPLSPPTEFSSVSKIVRFVSMIPYIEDYIGFHDRADVWCSNKEFLDIMAGDEDEHAVLLCCMLRHLGKEAYVCLGSTALDGQIALVLLKDGSHVLLIDSKRGKEYSVFDRSCPIKEIGCVVDARNVYANISPHHSPALLSWSSMKSNTNGWISLFSDSYPYPSDLSTIQQEISFSPISPVVISDLRRDLRNTIIDHIIELRSDVRDTNFHDPPEFGELLDMFERRSLGSAFSLRHHDRTVEHLTRGAFDLDGFPLNFSINLRLRDDEDWCQNILDRISSTQLHMNASRDAKFIVSVRVYPYANQICSAWIYYAVMTGRTATSTSGRLSSTKTTSISSASTSGGVGMISRAFSSSSSLSSTSQSQSTSVGSAFGRGRIGRGNDTVPRLQNQNENSSEERIDTSHGAGLSHGRPLRSLNRFES